MLIALELHLYLGGHGDEELAGWAQGGLRELETERVRGVLAEAEPGALTTRLRLALAEASLAELDLFSGRAALDGLNEREARPWRRWLDALDHDARWRPSLPDVLEVERAPRAAAAVCLLAMAWRSSHEERRCADDARILDQCLRLLDGPVRAALTPTTIKIMAFITNRMI